MADHSHLDNKYFIDSHIYNCPFCNRRHVSYYIVAKNSFDWTEAKKCHLYIAQCGSCSNRSMHLSFKDLSIQHVTNLGSTAGYRFNLYSHEQVEEIDDEIFYSVPTSFFTIDDRVPKILRTLMSEAEGCLKSNFLTGGSACARKLVYELGRLNNASGENYEDRIKSLKSIFPAVDAAYFDTLLTIQQVTSSKVHEESYDGWQANHLKLILATMAEILHEIYVVPAEREAKRKAILDLKGEVLTPKPKIPAPKSQ